MILVFMGPDGSGKSSVIHGVEEHLRQLGKDVRTFHLRPVPGVFRPASVMDPHGKPPWGKILSLLKLLHFWSSYLLGYRRVKRALQNGTIVIFDRFYHDLLVDPLRYRYGGPLWLAHWLAKSIFRPTLWILLDAPAKIMQARKKELSEEETNRLREGYQALFVTLSPSMVVDASQPLQQVIGSVIARLEALND